MKLGDIGLGLVLAVSIAAGCSSANSTKDNANAGGAGGTAATGGTDASIGGGAGQDAGITPDETVVVIGPGADADSPNKFGGPEDAFAQPEIAYPNDNLVAPANLNSLEVHFKPGTGQNLFEIRFESQAIAYVVYLGCTPLNGGCVYQTDKAFWEQLVDKNRGTPPVTYRVRGVNGDLPNSVVGVSEPRTLAFTKENIVGGLYYWNSTGVIQRYEFASPIQVPETYLTPQMAGALTCVGCHALSRDGKKMAVGADIPFPAPFKVYDVATRTQLSGSNGPLQGGANFFSFSKDGSKLLTSDGAKISLYDSVNGGILVDQLIPQATMPDFGPNDKAIVYARPQVPGLPINGVDSAGIEVMSFDDATNTVSEPKFLAQFQGKNNYYPAFSPTQDWVAFNRSPSNANSADNAPPSGDGELWVVASDATAPPIRMDIANQGGSTSWPKWVPNVASYYGGAIMFLTFSTGRAYGLRVAQGTTSQLWMIGFDPKKAKAGEDPSLGSFWFPYQDIASGNHIAQWVSKLERQPCTEDTECKAAEECIDGSCYPVIK